MKVYRGSRSGYDRQVIVVEGEVSADLSPVALGLLLDVTENREIASKYYQLFKADAVAHFGEKWEITEIAILAWLRDVGVGCVF